VKKPRIPRLAGDNVFHEDQHSEVQSHCPQLLEEGRQIQH
jgi:hypothetical protein